MKGIKKPVRTISGVTPLTVVLKPKKCDHGTCIYCPGGEDVPQSYTNKSPAIMRAMALYFDPVKQVENRLRVLNKMGHPTDKIELIILGGTFTQYPIDYQYSFIKGCFDALNEKKSKNLEEAKKLNETSKHRCVAMCIENRPDNCEEEDIKRMLEFGATRIELGVQIIDDKIYKKVNRGHTVKDVIEASKNLKNAGFKLGYHIMPGLPYSNAKKDLRLFKKLFKDDKFKPDQLKIYPCQVVESSILAKIYKKIGYKPYSDDEISNLLGKMMEVIPEYCRVMRVMREIPKEKMIVEPLKLDLRKNVEHKLREKKSKVKEIRMREIGFNRENLDLHLHLNVIKYKSSKGTEYFLQIVNKNNILFGLLRLRIYGKKAIIRELHVYGQALKLGEKKKGASQHEGLGKLLMQEAENIVKKNKIKELDVISGVGVRDYYRRLGYNLQGPYMVKEIISAQRGVNAPTGIRTRVTAVKGPHSWPLNYGGLK